MPATNARTGPPAITWLSTSTMSGLNGQQSQPVQLPSWSYQTVAALMGESVEAMVGTVTIFRSASTAAALAVSSTLPPPMPTATSAPRSSAICADARSLFVRRLAPEQNLDHLQAGLLEACLDGRTDKLFHAGIPQHQRLLAQHGDVDAEFSEHASALDVLTRRNQYGFHGRILSNGSSGISARRFSTGIIP